MPIGLLDLSIVTDRLLRHLSDSEAASTLWDEEHAHPPVGPIEPAGSTRAIPLPRFAINFTGLAPDAVRELGGCSLSLYLFHVAPDKFHRNTFPVPDRVDVPQPHLVPPRARRIPQQPFALTLYYLLSAHSANYIEEQQAMSIALKCFHDHPIVTAAITIDTPPETRTEEFTLTMEPENVDEIGRLWQAMSSPLRLSAVYRASVIFLEPEPETRTTKLVDRPSVSAYPEFAITRADVDHNRLATITGGPFVAGSVVVKVDNVKMDLDPTTAATFGDDTFRVASDTTLLIKLPSATPKGRYRLGVQLDPGQPEALFTLEVPV